MPQNDFLTQNRYRAYPFAALPAANGVDIRGILLAAHIVMPAPHATWTVDQVTVTATTSSVRLVGKGKTLTFTGVDGQCVTVSSGDCIATLILGKTDLPAGTYAVTNGALLASCGTAISPGITSLNSATELDPAIVDGIIQPRYAYAVTAVGLTGDMQFVEGYNAALQLADSMLTVNAVVGAGQGIPQSRPELVNIDDTGASTTINQDTAVSCRTAVTSINGVAVTKLGQFQIYEGTGVKVTPDAAGHKLTVKLLSIAELFPDRVEEGD